MEFNGTGGPKVTLAISIPYGGKGRDSSLMGEPYDDIHELKEKLDWNHPIKSIVVYHGALIDGIEVTYQMSNGDHVPMLHGSCNQEKSVITLEDNESIIEVNGIVAKHVIESRAYQVILINFTIFNSTTGFVRSAGTTGHGDHILQETRQDIHVAGPLVGLAGIANNKLSQVGLNTVKFYTRTP